MLNRREYPMLMSISTVNQVASGNGRMNCERNLLQPITAIFSIQVIYTPTSTTARTERFV